MDILSHQSQHKNTVLLQIQPVIHFSLPESYASGNCLTSLILALNAAEYAAYMQSRIFCSSKSKTKDIEIENTLKG